MDHKQNQNTDIKLQSCLHTVLQRKGWFLSYKEILQINKHGLSPTETQVKDISRAPEEGSKTAS